MPNDFLWQASEWVGEGLSLTAFFGTADIGVHVVHTSRVITTYTLESLSSFTKITHNIQASINFKKKYIKKETQQSEGTHYVDLPMETATLHQFTMILNT